MKSLPLFILIALSLFAVGCQSIPNLNAFTASNTNVGNGLVAIATNADAATKNLDAARSHADPVGQAAIDAAKRDLGEIQKQVPIVSKNNAAEHAEFVKAFDAAQKSEKENQELRQSFWSVRQKNLWRWAVGIAAGLFVGAIVMLVFLPAYVPVVLTGLKWIGHALTLGTFWIAARIGKALAAWRAGDCKDAPPGTLAVGK